MDKVRISAFPKSDWKGECLTRDAATMVPGTTVASVPRMP